MPWAESCVEKVWSFSPKHHGLYLSGEGFKETGCFEIVPPTENRHILQRAMDRAERDLEGKIRLVVNTDTTGFNDYERRKHENTLRQASLKLDAMRRRQMLTLSIAGTPRDRGNRNQLDWVVAVHIAVRFAVHLAGRCFFFIAAPAFYVVFETCL
jgi:hypothetical protein